MDNHPARPFDQLIFLIRSHRVMLDADLAALYQVRTKDLNKAVGRNLSRFPDDFMFQLSESETGLLRFQSGTSKPGRGGRRYRPYAFTEQGVAMLSTVLKSERAIRINIAIMRAFVKIRETLSLHKELAVKLHDLERRISSHDAQIQTVFDAITELREGGKIPPRKIGFTQGGRNRG